MKNNFKIRPAKSEDQQAIGAIADATELFPSEMLGNMMSSYLSGDSSDKWFVADEESSVLAFGFCEPERMTDGTWNLLAIGVSPPLQGKGIGGAMMRYIESTLAEADQRILLVETMDTPELARTREFYAKNSYTEEARIREFYEKGAGKVVFSKHL